jgi:hypothetical protein
MIAITNSGKVDSDVEEMPRPVTATDRGYTRDSLLEVFCAGNSVKE